MNVTESKHYAINALREYWEIRKKEFGLNSMIFVPLANFDEIDRYLKEIADMFEGRKEEAQNEEGE